MVADEEKKEEVRIGIWSDDCCPRCGFGGATMIIKVGMAVGTLIIAGEKNGAVIGLAIVLMIFDLFTSVICLPRAFIVRDYLDMRGHGRYTHYVKTDGNEARPCMN